jgi:hypothetical protein
VTHRVVISSKVAEILTDPEVREEFTPAQCAKIDQILNGPQPCGDEDFLYLVRRLARAYCLDD